MVLAAAYSHELPRYGLEVGLTNYAAAYCTGLLLARRVLKLRDLNQEYEGNVEATGEDFSVEPADGRRPFRALLDVGLIRTTTGNRVFGALKGALDGGLDIPHSDKRFAGFKKDEKQLDAEVHHKYIYGGHVADYMRTLAEESEKYQSHFREYIKKGIKADDVETLYKKVHAAIRADPSVAKSTKESPKEHKRLLGRPGPICFHITCATTCTACLKHSQSSTPAARWLGHLKKRAVCCFATRRRSSRGSVSFLFF
ncbi:hypothetical protein C2845_PM07G00960 [Panicum miliaceum]|uniref:Large ribosomal subunit protein uL18 C-terminal eukaryotes domain-containing protein n=1 Tax=Panicum miliaceum TaxID=4540 RepID=A0A3L6SL04_PANMI|nr:hypothetical protein C2845_PM07G00960 [Panicum miliaceum]